jgi:hypothetical protein
MWECVSQLFRDAEHDEALLPLILAKTEVAPWVTLQSFRWRIWRKHATFRFEDYAQGAEDLRFYYLAKSLESKTEKEDRQAEIDKHAGRWISLSEKAEIRRARSQKELVIPERPSNRLMDALDGVLPQCCDFDPIHLQQEWMNVCQTAAPHPFPWERECALFSLLCWFGEDLAVQEVLVNLLPPFEASAQSPQKSSLPDDSFFLAYSLLPAIAAAWAGRPILKPILGGLLHCDFYMLREEAARLLCLHYHSDSEIPHLLSPLVSTSGRIFGDWMRWGYRSLQTMEEGLAVLSEVSRSRSDPESERFICDAVVHLVVIFGPRLDLLRRLEEIAANSQCSSLKERISEIKSRFCPNVSR